MPHGTASPTVKALGWGARFPQWKNEKPSEWWDRIGWRKPLRGTESAAYPLAIHSVKTTSHSGEAKDTYTLSHTEPYT